jgi:hypothetical protein
MYDRFETTRETSALLAEARLMRDEAVARMITSAWRSLRRFPAKLLHSAHLPSHGQPRAH